MHVSAHTCNMSKKKHSKAYAIMFLLIQVRLYAIISSSRTRKLLVGVNNMLKEERQQEIIHLLNREQKVLTNDLSKLFSVSEDTIRRDLKELDQQNLIRRVHSGALRAGPPVTDFKHRQNVSSETKQLIAKKALPFLKEDTVIIIDGGTTNLQLIKLLPIDFRATIITNSPPIAMGLDRHSNIEVIMVGGSLYKKSMVNLGIDTVESLLMMRADQYIMGVYNIDPQNGTSVPTLAEAQVKRAMAKISTEILGLVTSDKLGTVTHHIVIPTDELTYLFTDNVRTNISKEYSRQKVTVIN